MIRAHEHLPARDASARRPAVVGAPLVGSGLERRRLRELERPLVLEPVGEPRRLDVLAERGRGGAAEIDGSELLSGWRVPAAVIPGTDHQIVQVLRIVGLERLVDLDGPEEILLIPPARDGEGRNLDPVEIRRDGLRLPELIVVRVRHEVVPRRRLVVQHALVGVGERPELEIPVVEVGLIELVRREVLRHLHYRGVLESVAQTECAVVMEVIADEHVGRRRPGRDGLERGMRIEHCHDGEPSRIRRSQHPHAAVVVRHVRQKPGDGVVGIGALIRGRAVALVPHRTQHDELAFRLEAPADVLKNEDVSLAHEIRQGLARERPVHALDAVRRPRHQYREITGRATRREDDRVQMHAVPHGYLYFRLVERRIGGESCRHDRHRRPVRVWRLRLRRAASADQSGEDRRPLQTTCGAM